MTPKEKAEELVAKMRKQVVVVAGTTKDLRKSTSSFFEKNAKQCALIAVDEIVAELESLNKPEYTAFVLKWGEDPETMDGYERLVYWEQVQEEINKLSK